MGGWLQIRTIAEDRAHEVFAAFSAPTRRPQRYWWCWDTKTLCYKRTWSWNRGPKRSKIMKSWFHYFSQNLQISLQPGSRYNIVLWRRIMQTCAAELENQFANHNTYLHKWKQTKLEQCMFQNHETKLQSPLSPDSSPKHPKPEVQGLRTVSVPKWKGLPNELG